MTQRRSWTKQEDQTLKYLKEDKKMAKWSQIAQRMATQFGLQGRNQKQCRERYHNHLDQNITLEKLADKEEELLFESHDQIGNKWSLIAMRFKGRTDNYLKNHFYSKLRSAIRRINRLIKENWKKNSSTFSLNIVYKIVEISDQNCQLNEGLSQKQEFFFILKNQILQFGGAKLTKDYFQSIHQDDQVEYLIGKLKKFEKIYALAKGIQNKNIKEEGQFQSQHTLPKSDSENDRQSKKLFKIFQSEIVSLKKQVSGTRCLIKSQSELKSKSNSTSSIQPELVFAPLVFIKSKSINQIHEQDVSEDSEGNLISDLLKDEDIQLPTFRRRTSNYSIDSSFHLNEDSFQLRDSRNFLEMKSFDSMLSIDYALFQ